MIATGSRRALVLRFWKMASGFWRGPSRVKAWTLTVGLVAISLSQIAVQYRLNYWTRDIFNAVGEKDAGALVHQAWVLLPLIVLVVSLAVGAVFGRMTMQRNWRAWLVHQLVGRWVAHGHYYQLNLLKGDHQVPEGRITDDARTATDAPVDFAVGLFQSVVSGITFIGVLWFVGGALTLEIGSSVLRVPGYLVVFAVVYSILITLCMMYIARRFALVSESINQAEAEFRYGLTHVRENGESIALLGGESEERVGLLMAFKTVVERWRLYCHQHMRATVVSNTNYIIAPAIPIFLCMPKYLSGDMTLGDVTQAAAAFVQVQSAFNWLVDNYPRFADWMASARRVESLVAAIDQLEALEEPGGIGTIRHSQKEGIALRLLDLTVALDDGTVVISETDVLIRPSERVLIVGESGTGKSTLVRAIAGLWPWGSGEIATMKDACMFLMPQQPYMPLGSLRRAMTCPMPAGSVTDTELRNLMATTGLGHLVPRLDTLEPWHQVLSGGEKQRIAFVRLFLSQPDIVIMDEATSALDPDSQTLMMSLLADRLPDVAVISISHRPELAVFHDRQLRFEHRPGGSQLVSDITLPPSKRRLGNLRSRLGRLGGRAKHASEPPHTGTQRENATP